MTIDIEKVTDDRYRLRAHGQVMTVSAHDLLDVMEYGIIQAKQLEAERDAARADHQPGVRYRAQRGQGLARDRYGTDE